MEQRAGDLLLVAGKVLPAHVGFLRNRLKARFLCGLPDQLCQGRVIIAGRASGQPLKINLISLCLQGVDLPLHGVQHSLPDFRSKAANCTLQLHAARDDVPSASGREPSHADHGGVQWATSSAG